MKLAYIDVTYTKQVELPEGLIAGLPGKVIFFTTIQFHSQYEKLKGQLEAAGKSVVTLRPKHAWKAGQLLGCGVEAWTGPEAPATVPQEAKDAEAFLYVGDGAFHPTALLFKNDLPVHCFNPKSGEQKIITKEEIASILKKRKGALVTFHSAKKVGVLVTTKHGQQRLALAKQLEKKYPEKEFYVLLDDTINPASLEDFPFLEVYVNTACPRMADDDLPRPVLNVADVLDIAW